MKFSQLKWVSNKACYLFLGAIVAGFFNLNLLEATNSDNQERLKEHEYINESIQVFERVGRYDKALETARKAYQAALVEERVQEAQVLFQRVDYLEQQLLSMGYSRVLFDENYEPRAQLLQLLEVVGMPSLDSSQEAIFQINDWAQKNLLRQGERWQEQTTRFEALKTSVNPLLSELGFIETVAPHFKEYEGAIVHGALLPRVRHRLHYLIEQWKQGVRFTHLYFLGGERPLEATKENKEAFIDDKDSALKIRSGWIEPEKWPETECEMMQLVWEQSDIPPDMLKQVKVFFVNAPMKKDPRSEKLIRPTTDDTILSWLKLNPLCGRYLAITNAPYINRQDMVIRMIATSGYGFDTVGSGASEQEKMAIFLDELARLVFQTKLAYEKTLIK